MKCGSVTCKTDRNEDLPPGKYLIGDINRGTAEGGTKEQLRAPYWFNMYAPGVLYPIPTQEDEGCVWDYNTKIPYGEWNLRCQGGFAFHTGTNSAGCVTVEDTACMKDLVEYLHSVQLYKWAAGSYPMACRVECRTCWNLLVNYGCFGGVHRMPEDITYMGYMHNQGT